MNRRKILTGLAASPLTALPVAAAATPEERIEAARHEIAELLGGRCTSVVSLESGLFCVMRHAKAGK